VGPLPSAKNVWHIDNSLDPMIATGLVHNSDVAFISIFYGSRTLRLAKVIGAFPIFAVYVAAYPD
jgi:hypothetical protein